MKSEVRTSRPESAFRGCEVCGANVKAENLANHQRRVHPRARALAATPAVRRSGPRRGTLPLRAAVLLLAVLLAAAAVGYIALRSSERGRPVEPGATRVTVSMSGFTPNRLSLRAGDELRINLINLDNSFHSDGGGNHNFVTPALGVTVLVPPEGQQVFGIRASSPGTYTWYCDICCGGKDNPAMVGTLTVTS